MSRYLEPVADTNPISRVRRNHGLEHATLHILAQRHPRQSMAGYSNTGGFWILADLPSEEVESAARQALSRLRGGEHQLAVHPNCGTNFVTSGAVAGIAGALTMFGAGPRLRDKFERLSLAALAATFGLILAQPLGNLLQARLTTSGVPGALEIVSVSPSRHGRWTAHRVTTWG